MKSTIGDSMLNVIFVIGSLSMLTGSVLAGNPVFFSPDARLLTSCSAEFYMPPISAGTENFFVLQPSPRSTTLGFNSGIVHCTWNEMEATSRPVAVWFTPRTMPWNWTSGGYPSVYPSGYPYTEFVDGGEPDLMARVIHNRYHAGSRVDYLFGELEKGPITYSELGEIMAHMADVARGSFSVPDPFGMNNPLISGAVIADWEIKVGNYRIAPQQYGTLVRYNSEGQQIGSFTGLIDPAGKSWTQATSTPTHLHNIYYDSGLNLAMPRAYLDGADVVHAAGRVGADTWSDPSTRAPTPRAAMFWSALETTSAAIRECEDHDCGPGESPLHVVPFVSPYYINQDFDTTSSSSQYYGGWFPPPEDFLAFIKHIKLRGVEGFVFWRNSWYEVNELGDPIYPYLFNRYEIATWYDENAEFLNPPSDDSPAAWFVRNAVLSWEDIVFESDAVPYRLVTDKHTGVFVSAMNDHGQLIIQISVLDESGTGSWTVDMNDYFPFARDYEYAGQSWGTTIDVDDASNLSTRGHTTTYEFYTPDLNGDHIFSLDDLALFSSMWLDSDLRLDWNRDDLLDLNDVQNFISAFADATN